MLQAEVERMSAENQRLRDMLSQVTNDYNSLHMHILALTQEQKGKGNSELDPEEKKLDNGRIVVPRQFIDLGLASAEDPNADDHSPSSSEDRSPDRLGSPVNNTEAVSNDQDRSSKEYGKTSRREVSPDPHVSSQGWSPSKVPRFSPPKNNVDQTEATMRKARVSVRARSEAAMVQFGCIIRTIDRFNYKPYGV